MCQHTCNIFIRRCTVVWLMSDLFSWNWIYHSLMIYIFRIRMLNLLLCLSSVRAPMISWSWLACGVAVLWCLRMSSRCLVHHQNYIKIRLTTPHILDWHPTTCTIHQKYWGASQFD